MKRRFRFERALKKTDMNNLHYESKKILFVFGAFPLVTTVFVNDTARLASSSFET